MVQGTGRIFSEYDAWLQAGGGKPVGPLRLAARAEAGSAAALECVHGMEKLYGADVWQDDSPYTLSLCIDETLPPEGYCLKGSPEGISIAGGSPAGALYGVYALLLRLRQGGVLEQMNERSAPAVPLRVLNHWDALDGTVERGYAGGSLFFSGGGFSYDAARVRDYARLLASIGINAVAVNNVNVDEQSVRLITPALLPEAARLAGVFRPFGIRLVLAVHFESPALLGGLPTADPLDGRVQAWWREKMDEVYRYVPDLAGLLVKADSEFRSGPAEHGRTQADGANVLAAALAPHGGVVFWRCFVYNCRQDWRDAETDRPKAAYEHFRPLDGKFAPNVMLQIKYGPSDFQVREPLSPLFGAMKHTREALELQITQEYTGQQIDLYALAVQWEEILSSSVDETRRLSDLLGDEVCAVCGVSNTGGDRNWTGHTLAQANLYAFGRMAWNPALTSREVIREWAALTFGHDNPALDALSGMMLASRGVYEKYTSPLGIGWMVNTGHHYGPSVDGYEYMRWGTYHRADHEAIGVERTALGTGFTKQYDPWLAGIYDSMETCPEELLLYFHRLSYDYRLKNGKTLIQYIYDSHFEGVEAVEGFIRLWESLDGSVPGEAWLSVRTRLYAQLENAKEWRDVINTYFLRKAGIPDEKGRRIFK